MSRNRARDTVMIRVKGHRLSGQRGSALPLALLVVMILGVLGGVYSRISVQNLRTQKLNEATVDAVEIAEGVAHDLVRQMVILPHLWREKVPLATVPLNYVEYSPLSFSATNGIPTCSGVGCHRNRYPTGGGLLKNAGPVGGYGDTVDATLPVTSQVDPSDLPPADLTLNGLSAWSQVERLDELMPGASSIGGDLANNPGGGTNANAIRFRITGTTRRAIRAQTAQPEVVVVVEVPVA